MDPADPGIADPGLLGVLPETGGALILYVAALLIIVGTAVMLLRNLRSL